MKPVKILSAAVPVLLGLAAALWTPLAVWCDMKEGLIAFLGFLAAALVQVMTLTANFLQSDRLTPTEAERLTTSLTRQQHYWVGLLFATVTAMVIVVAGAALSDRLRSLTPFFQHPWVSDIGWSSLATFLIVASVSFVLVKMLGLFEGVLALHRLRGELVINSAKRDAAEKAAAIQKEAEINVPLVPPDYGQIIRPH